MTTGERIRPQVFFLDGSQLRRLRQQCGRPQQTLANDAAYRWYDHPDVVPFWGCGSRPTLHAFAAASANLYAEIARDDPQPWKLQLARAAVRWLASRA